MTTPPHPMLRDLRLDRAGRYIYIPLTARLGAYAVPADRAAALDRAASKRFLISNFVTCLLVGLVPGSVAAKLGALGLGLTAMAIGRQGLASGLERVVLAPGSLVPRSVSLASWAHIMGRFQLRVSLAAGILLALLPLPLLVTEPPLSGIWLSALALSAVYGLVAVTAWRAIQSLPRRSSTPTRERVQGPSGGT